MFYQLAGGLFIVVFATQIIRTIFNLIDHENIFNGSIYILQSLDLANIFFFLFVWTLGVILPGIAVALARRFPAAPEVIFHSDKQITTWKSGNNQLELPFNAIHFATSRLLSKSGISTVMVSVFAIGDKPFFKGETPSEDPEARYRKDLCVYKAGTQAEADESIDIIKSFMAGTYDESPSKFDNI
jgi:hypothetical protein